MEGLLYEPRSFWSIGNFTPEGALTPRRIRLPREHFFNGERYPIQIKRLVLSSINYGFMREPPAVGFAANATGYHETTANMSAVEVAISAPQRYHLGTKRYTLSAAIAPQPRWMPRPRATAAPVAGARLSSLWGQSMLKLDKPIYLPQQATIEWALSAHTPFASAAGAESTAVAPFATLLYQESGGNVWPGSARTTPPTVNPFRSGFPLEFQAAASILGIPRDPQERWPYPPDASFDAASAPAGGSAPWWPPLETFTGKQFDAQESTRSGSTCITDLRAHIDQRAFDRAMQSAFGPTPFQPTPMSLRTGTRIRLVNGGSKAWWWRPGAPLALVFDAITPANVYELPEPITLGPEEHLEIEVVFPGSFPQGDTALEPTAYHLGLSLNGYAAIEG